MTRQKQGGRGLGENEVRDCGTRARTTLSTSTFKKRKLVYLLRGRCLAGRESWAVGSGGVEGGVRAPDKMRRGAWGRGL